ncbi:MAG: DUF3565 domain-containing protein [Pseudomonadota bacterium]
MQRAIVDFEVDDAEDWVAVLSCGHPQHVRHQPPFINRPWTQSEAGRLQMLGTTLDCVRCERLELPEGLVSYRRTPEFNATTVPLGLLRDHATKTGVWGRIVVSCGIIRYVVTAPFAHQQDVVPGQPGIIAPEALHRVALSEDAEFHVEFLRPGK